MKFSAREDIEAPIDFVFERVSDFDAVERQALRRGSEVKRLDGKGEPKVGSAWDIKFKFRGKSRKMHAEIMTMSKPNLLNVHSLSTGIEGETIIELVALSRNRTRIAVTMELKPKSLTARLLMQTLKLAKSNLSQKFKQRVSNFAIDTEGRYS